MKAEWCRVLQPSPETQDIASGETTFGAGVATDNGTLTTLGCQRGPGLCVPLLIWLAAVLSNNLALAQQRTKPPAIPVVGSQRQEWFKERDRYDQESHELWSDGKLPEAIAAAEKMQAMEREVYGPEDDHIADSLAWLAQLHAERNDWATARKLGQEGLALSRKLHGNDDWRVFDTHSLVGYLDLLKRLSPSDAQQLMKAARIFYRAFELQRQGKAEAAVPLAEKALAIRKRLLGDNDRRTAESLCLLAQLQFNQGDNARAELLYRQSQEIRKKVLGESHPNYTAGLKGLAEMYMAQGDFARAGPLLLQAVEINKKAFGENHPEYAISVDNLALLYKAQGDYTQAEQLFREAVEIQEKTVGEEHRDYGHSLDCLASLYLVQGDRARAEPLYLQALEIKKKTLGENHPMYADTLDGVGLMYLDQGDYARAEPFLLQAMEIKKKVFGETHPIYAGSLHNLAALYRWQGDFAHAEPYSRQALEIEKKSLGENHPNYANSLGGLGLLYLGQGDYARAEPLVRQAVTTQCNQLEATAASQSERQQLVMLDAVRPYLNAYLAMSAAKPQSAAPAYRLMLAWKGMVFRRERLARAGEQTPDLAGLFRQLQHVAGQLAGLAWATPDPQQADRWRESIASLSEKKERLEADLSARSAAFRRAKAPPNLEDIQAALPKDVVLVDFLEYLRREWVAVPQRGGLGIRFELADGGTKIIAVVAGGAAAKDGRLQRGDLIVEITDPVGKWTAVAGKTVQVFRDILGGDAGSKVGLRVRRAQEKELREIVLTRAPLPWQKQFEWRGELENVAFVVRHDGPVVRINFGPAKPVREAIDTWRQTCGMSPQSAAAGRLVREKLWEPIAAQIHDAKIVLISPDGALSKLPLGALPGKVVGKYLIEEYPLAIVPSAQMIPDIVQHEARKASLENLLLVGNINYDSRPDQAANTPSSPKAPGQDSPQGFVHFNRLPATQREVALIEKLYHQGFGSSGIQTLEEGRATKAAFLAQASRYRYLHLATHGFFIQEKLPTAATQTQRGVTRFGGPQSVELHAGLLSGLALAGANQAGMATGGDLRVSSSADNGILTAEEIGTQNLDGVQLVMLSACETGLGKAAGGEGLLGLQRSFQAAGARSVVASLWKVPDEETKALMGAFYTNLWQKKLSPLESLRQAQLAMLRNYDPQAGQLRAPDFSQTVALPTGGAVEGPAAGRRTRLSPAYWAAFVLSGDWR